MKKLYDIILYFSWVHSSHIHKYLALKEELNKYVNTLLIFGNGQLGVSQDQEKAFDKFFDNTITTNLNQATQILLDNKPKILIFGSDKQTSHWQRQINNQLSRSTTVQLPSCHGPDLYYSGTDLIAVLGPVQEILNKNLPDAAGVNKININPWLYDLVEDCLPYQLSKEQFCEKYRLKANEEIFLWLPDMTTVSGAIIGTKEEALQRYKKVCELENVITKVHPNEFKRYKSEKINNKWSYEIAGAHSPILDPIDAHWAYKYCDCGISDTSITGIEFGFFNKPFIYLDECAPQVDDGSHWEKFYIVNGKNYFSWVGHECPSNQLNEFIEKKQYKIKDNSLYQQHREKFCENPNKTGIKLLTEAVLELL